MENELERFHNQNLQLELNIDELRQKLKAAEREMLQERQKVRLFVGQPHLKVFFQERCAHSKVTFASFIYSVNAIAQMLWIWSVKAREEEAVVRRLKTDLHNCVGYIQEPKLLKDSIKAMYQKHVHEDMVNSLHTIYPSTHTTP